MQTAALGFPFRGAARLIPPGVILILPVVLALWWRRAALGLTGEDERTARWKFYDWGELVPAAIIAAWWAAWDAMRLYGIAAAYTPLPGLLFWLPPAASVGAFLAVGYATSARVFRLKRTAGNNWRLAWWRVVNFALPLLLAAGGFDDLFAGKARGIVWLVLAIPTRMVGAYFLRTAEGMRLREAKNSETRNRAIAMARRMGVELREVYVVPAGRERLTNAWSGGRSVIISDSLGKWLSRAEMDFVLAHELAHVEARDGRKQQWTALGVFAAMAVLAFVWHGELSAIRPLLDPAIVLLPLMLLYAQKRRGEFAADRRAVEVTGDAEAGIRELMKLSAGLAGQDSGRIAGWFRTHPGELRRIEAIGRAGELPAERIAALTAEFTSRRARAARHRA